MPAEQIQPATENDYPVLQAIIKSILNPQHLYPCMVHGQGKQQITADTSVSRESYRLQPHASSGTVPLQDQEESRAEHR